MSDRKSTSCTACKNEIVPGILFCWRHPPNGPTVGEIAADHGQLLWSTTAACTSRLERAVAVLLDNTQVQVRRASADPRMGRIELEVGPPASTGAASTSVYVRLTDLLDALLAGDEQVEASRSA